jgi:alkylhydroperoxidase family enzyme
MVKSEGDPLDSNPPKGTQATTAAMAGVDRQATRRRRRRDGGDAVRGQWSEQSNTEHQLMSTPRKAIEMDTFLPRIDKPRNPVMKMVYAMDRRTTGKVTAPISVFAARMPIAFGNFYGKVSRLDKKLKLPHATALVIREQVASINMCMFCMDAARWFALKEAPENQARFDALPQYKTSPLFSDAERAALDYASELTRSETVQPETFNLLRRFYSEREICDIVWLVASEHVYNVTNRGLGIGSEGLCALSSGRARRRSKPSRSDQRSSSAVS